MFTLMSISATGVAVSATEVATKVAADISQVAETTSSGWETVLGYVATFILIPLGGVLVRWLNNQAKLLRDKADVEKATGRVSLKFELEEVLHRIASNLANKERKELEEIAKDGKIDTAEWEKAREAALAQAGRDQQDMLSQMPAHTLGATGSRRRPFLLSTLPQFDLVRRFRLMAAGSLAAFFIAGTIAAWMLGTRLSG